MKRIKKTRSEFGKKVWIVKNKEGKIVEKFISRCNAIKFQKESFDEVTIERKTPKKEKPNNTKHL